MTAGKMVLCPQEIDSMLNEATDDSDIFEIYDIKEFNSWYFGAICEMN